MAQSGQTEPDRCLSAFGVKLTYAAGGTGSAAPV
jgi:hypothetical protein